MFFAAAGAPLARVRFPTTMKQAWKKQIRSLPLLPAMYHYGGLLRNIWRLRSNPFPKPGRVSRLRVGAGLASPRKPVISLLLLSLKHFSCTGGIRCTFPLPICTGSCRSLRASASILDNRCLHASLRCIQKMARLSSAIPWEAESLILAPGLREAS